MTQPFLEAGLQEVPEYDYSEQEHEQPAIDLSVINELELARAANDALRQHVDQLVRTMNQTIRLMRGIASDDIEINYDPANGSSYWSIPKALELLEELESTAVNQRLSVYVERDGGTDKIYVRTGFVVWTKAIPTESIQVVDPTSGFTPVAIPGSGTDYVCVKVLAPHASDDISANTTIEVESGTTPTALYQKNKSDNGSSQIERWWILAGVDSTGVVTPFRPGGDILELRQG
jgi:hypothetical protein